VVTAVLQHLSIILVCGPAGGGKTTLAGQLAEALDCPVVATDSYKHLAWDEVPLAVGESLALFDEPGAVVVLEGVRALSAVQKCGIANRVREVIWVEIGAEKPGTAGMTTRQRNLLRELPLPAPILMQSAPLRPGVVEQFVVESVLARLGRGDPLSAPAMYFVPRPDGCECHQEIGDSPCQIHPGEE
jgi:hypothetical protein